MQLRLIFHKDDFKDHNVYLDVNAYLDVFYFFENPNKTYTCLVIESLRMINILYLH
jgi:hypothetical protein